MLNPGRCSSGLLVVCVAVGGLLLPGCQKRESEPVAKAPAPEASRPAPPPAAVPAPSAPAEAPAAPGALSMGLEDPRAVMALLEQSGLKLKEAKDDCALLAEEHGTLGALVQKVKSAKDKTVRCEPNGASKTWACKAEFKSSGGAESEATDFALALRFVVDDSTRSLQPESLVCFMAG